MMKMGDDDFAVTFSLVVCFRVLCGVCEVFLPKEHTYRLEKIFLKLWNIVCEGKDKNPVWHDALIKEDLRSMGPVVFHDTIS